MMEIRVATKSDIHRHYTENGGVNHGYSMRAITAEHNGRIMGLAGVYYQKDRSAVAFSDMVPEMRAFRKDIVRVTRMVIDLIKRREIQAVALCVDQSGLNFCKKLGFVEVTSADIGTILKWWNNK